MGGPADAGRHHRSLEERGISFDELRSVTNQPDADPFDLLCHVAFNAPLRTRRERADRLRKEERAFFEQYGPEARQMLDELLEKYAEHGTAQFAIPDVLKVPPISKHGNVMEIAGCSAGRGNCGRRSANCSLCFMPPEGVHYAGVL